MGTHTISNASTFHGWLESVGLDDFFDNPCSCIFGDDEELAQPVPVPGQRRSTRQSGHGPKGGGGPPGTGSTRRGQMSRQATIEVEEPNSPFASFSFFGGSRH